MGKSDLQSAIGKWQQRVSAAHSAGIPSWAYQSLMTRDIQSVIQGHSPMQDKDVTDAIMSAVGRSPVKDPSSGTGLFDIIGNIPSDIENIVTGYIPGTIGYVASLPQQL